MYEHLHKILSQYSLRTDLIDKFTIDPFTHMFRDNICEEDRWEYYKWICKELNIKDKVTRSHGMTSEFASEKKNDGHEGEFFFEQFGFDVSGGINKTDITKDGKSYASIKSGAKIQWGMHVFSSLSEKYQELFSDWIKTFGNDDYDIEDRKQAASVIIEKLQDKDVRYDLFNYYLRKDESVPFLIIKDLSKDKTTYYEVDFEELIRVICDNVKFYHTKDKVKIVGIIELKKYNKVKMSNNFVIFEFEPRADKSNAILLHGQSSVIIDVINDYGIKVIKTYE